MTRVSHRFLSRATLSSNNACRRSAANRRSATNSCLSGRTFSTAGCVANKNLIEDVLASTATKRDAKSYLKNFVRDPVKRSSGKEAAHHPKSDVNLGRLFAGSAQLYASDGENKALFEPSDGRRQEETQILHAAVVKIRAPQLVEDKVLHSIGRTITQLLTLGMQSIVVVEPWTGSTDYSQTETHQIDQDVNRVLEALNLASDVTPLEEHRAQRVDHVFEFPSPMSTSPNAPGQLSDSAASFVNANLLISPVGRGVVPILSPLGTATYPKLEVVRLGTNSMIVELVKVLQGSIIQQSMGKGKSEEGLQHSKAQEKTISIDRIIVLEPWGGIPSAERAHAPHVYINLKQEYADIEEQTLHYSNDRLDQASKAIHLDNLNLMKATLDMLPDSASGLIVTPEDVARSHSESEQSSSLRVQTRSKRNPLIHNLLTDKPSISSSLPYGRSSGLGYGGPTSTFLKRGMQLTTIPDVFKQRWTPVGQVSTFSLIDDPAIDRNKLFGLIEASFGKRLDTERYLARIKDRFAGLVVAGDYEGCALFTWESAPFLPELKIPYLDKFAVLPQSQGTGASVADILFTCMIMDCFPDGVCWRSRASNPVNKWYFERAKGAWKLPGSRWTAFWTTDKPSPDELRAYEFICRDIPPTWPS